MVTLDTIRYEMEKKLQNDKDLQCVEVSADSLDAALADAAIQLDSRVANLEYEVLEKGSNGFLGLMKKHWTIRVYENEEIQHQKKQKKQEEASVFAFSEEEQEEVIQDRDGLFYIRHFGSDICLKVLLPIGSGRAISMKDVLSRLKRSDTKSYDEGKIKKYIEKGTEEKYLPIGEFTRDTGADSYLAVDISSDELKATITVAAPGIGGSDISAEQIKRMLSTQGVVVGISDEKISQFIDDPIYDIPYVVAEAILPINGRDAYIVYNFETDKSKLKTKQSDSGQINYKELNLIQNVVEGQVLAQKMLPEQGKSGKTVCGRFLEAKNGKDISIPLGNNVVVDVDGRTILAETNGQVMLVGDKITVEPIMEVGDVSIKTGNITFLGTVIVKGNVDDGFNVKASGNIEIHGSVGKCIIEADGDVVVSQGIMGRDEAVVRCGKSLWAKFIQNTTIEVGSYVIVSDSIVNSNVTCDKKIIVNGKRAAIIGGHLFATEEIYAKNIGSAGGGTETVLEVGYNPKAKRRLNDLLDKQNAFVRELEDLELNIGALENMKKVRRTLPVDKEENLKNYIKRRDEIQTESKEISEEIQEIQHHLRELKVIGKVSASGTVYSGVKVYIRDEKDDIQNDIKGVTFYYDEGFVRRGKYEPPSQEDLKKVPDGYSTS